MYLCSIVLGFALHLAWPVGFLPPAVARPVGWALIVAASVLFAVSVRTFRAAGTPVPGNRPTVVIVRTGPYCWSRNPIYVAFSLFQLGIAVAANSVWMLVTLVPAVALMACVVVPREERYLENRFSAQYLSYKRSVRRWL